MTTISEKHWKSIQNILPYLLLGLTAILITGAAIFFQQVPFLVFPLYISLVVGMLQARASRYAHLVGSLNSVLYAATFLYLGLYASMCSALFISFPLQLATFIRWSKNADGNSTKFKKLTPKQWGVMIIAFVLSFIALYFIMQAMGSDYLILDNSHALIGFFATVLSLFAFKEYSYLMIGSGTLTVLLYLEMIAENPAQMTHLIYAIYTLICIVCQFFSVSRIYQKQQKQFSKNHNTF